MKKIIILLCLIWSMTATAQKANFFLKDGNKRIADFIELKNDTISVEVTLGNGAKKRVQFPKEKFEKVIFTTGEYLNLTLSNYKYVPAKVEDDVWGVQETEEVEKPVVALSDFDGHGIDDATLSSLTDRFSTYLLATDSFKVMERNQMEMILKEQGFQQTGVCNEASCLVEIGQLIAVNMMITGSIGKVGGIYTVTARMIDVGSGKIVKNISEDCECPIEDVLIITMNRIAKKLAGLEVKEQKKKTYSVARGNAGLFVKSDIKNARIYLDGKMLDNYTPANIENLIPGSHILEVKKTIDGVLWQANSEINLISNRVVRKEFKLEKAKTVLKLVTVPSDAELYLDKKRTLSVDADYITPAIISNITKGKKKILLFKPGYKDTLLSLDINPFVVNSFSVTLNIEPDPVLVLKQKTFVSKRNLRKKAKVLSYISAGLVVAGGIVFYMAQDDNDRATETKKQLEGSTIHSGTIYEDLVKSNNDAVSAFESKRNIAFGLLGTGGLGGVLSALFYF